MVTFFIFVIQIVQKIKVTRQCNVIAHTLYIILYYALV